MTDGGVPVELDLMGLKCPLPALRTRRALAAMRPGDRLRVLATDPLAGIDVPHAAREVGGRLVATGEHGGTGAAWFLPEAGRPDADTSSATP